MAAKRYVVLDKSFLRSTPKSTLTDLSKRYDFLASATLMGECFQTFLPSKDRDNITRRLNIAALMKFSDASCSLYSMPSVEYLVGQEVRSRRPCCPIEDYIRSKIQFNPNYFGDDARMRDEESTIVDDWTSKVRESVEISVGAYTQGWLWPLCEWDNELKTMAAQHPIPTKEIRLRVKELLPIFKRRISDDQEFVRSQYNWMRPFGHPGADKIDSRWLLFRSIQTMLLIHLNLVEKNSASSHKMSDKNTTHEWLDFQYCLLAAQIGALATGEHSQKERFLQLRPDGVTLFYDLTARQVAEEGLA